MLQTLNYQTAALPDNYSIFKEAVKIGKVYKKEWLGWTMDAEIAGRRFSFSKRGLFQNIIHIEDKDTHTSLGALTIQPFFRWMPRAMLKLADGSSFRWMNSRLFSADWQWREENRIVMSAKEPWHLNMANGSILVRASVKQKELLLSLGLLLRNNFGRRSLLSLLVCLALLAMGILSRLFLGQQ
ncbi:hypothetical protein GA0116948_12015 [Chitinophaga costaii]|uniref:Uncharacterized protein n=1 Tax=Chitinophaga costaii TaxID=1335309 RepID=A0A1C4G290_9BACT|nr:hypothetical protein [Chitinophaga costaii]PUZ19777.1 hypothetical protein DCM91_20095 [Chitinophaga costaii]SCC62307.1 hypothetical protein GA0116948_12015 [Chitinophaga costaii]